jgi:uncharacterized protein (TIGR02145 family)
MITVVEGNSGTFIDARDGHTYKWVKIGTQIWMAENLAYKTETGSWAYNNEEANVAIYGRLYDWGTAMNGAGSSTENPSGVQGVCPSGWHLPSETELIVLSTFLGGDDVAGGKMKEAGLDHWLSPNTGATNISGFTGLPGGYRYINGTFYDMGWAGDFWFSTEYSTTSALTMLLSMIWEKLFYGSSDKEQGFSVRCVKN